MTARLLIALALAVVTAFAVDQAGRRGVRSPPGFAFLERRLLAFLLLVLVFFLGVFTPMVSFDLPQEIDLEALRFGDLFVLQAVLATALALWYVLGFVGLPGADRGRPATAWMRLFGLRAREPLAELSLGVLAGFGAWFVVLLAAGIFGQALRFVVGDDVMAQIAEPPEVILWMAGLPVLWRLAVSLTAGVVEEIFFRGFLQPRVGVTLSTALFVAGHLSYGQPLMLFGITLLSLLYAGLYSWRRSVWAPMAAHVLFDAVQLLVVIPQAVRLIEAQAAGG